MPKNTLGDGPIDEKYRVEMNRLADLVDEYFNGGLRGKDRKSRLCALLLLQEFDEAGERC